MKDIRYRIEGKDTGWTSRLQQRFERWLFRQDWGPRKRVKLEAMSDALWTWRVERQAAKLLLGNWNLHMACFKRELERDHQRLQRELYERV